MTLETPALLIDEGTVKKNIQKTNAYALDNGMAVRPHIKTHKLVEFAKLQMAMGACGITCAKLSEAEVMCRNGIADIFIAYPIIGASKINRLLTLHGKARIISGVDSLTGAKALSDAAVAAGTTLELRLEVDTGMHRTGVPLDQALDLAKAVNALPGLKLTGIFTFKSAIVGEKATADARAAAVEESRLMRGLAETLRAAGIPVTDVSGGSTPTAQYAMLEPGLTEIRPGTAIYNDASRVIAGAAGIEECAAQVLVTVVSTPAPDRAIIDGGSKIFAGDAKGGVPPLFLKGYGMVVGHPDLVFERMSEEHGVLLAPGGVTNLAVGDELRVIPNHICTTVNLFSNAHILREDGHYDLTPIDCRGCSY